MQYNQDICMWIAILKPWHKQPSSPNCSTAYPILRGIAKVESFYLIASCGSDRYFYKMIASSMLDFLIRSKRMLSLMCSIILQKGRIPHVFSSAKIPKKVCVEQKEEDMLVQFLPHNILCACVLYSCHGVNKIYLIIQIR